MPDLTPLYHKVKDTLEESCLIINERYIEMATLIIYRVFPKSAVDSFIDGPGVPPTGPDTSGDCHEPEAPEPPSNSGKAEREPGQPRSASTRNIVIDANPHLCTKCNQIIKPGEKYITKLKKTPARGVLLPRAVYEAEHIICPGN